MKKFYHWAYGDEATIVDVHIKEDSYEICGFDVEHSQGEKSTIIPWEINNFLDLYKEDRPNFLR